MPEGWFGWQPRRIAMTEDEVVPPMAASPVGPVHGAVNALVGTAIGWAWIASLDLAAIVLTDIVLADGEDSLAL